MIELFLIFILAAVLVMQGIETFLDANKRKDPREMIQATLLSVAGIFLASFWVKASQTSGGMGSSSRLPYGLPGGFPY